MRRNTKDIILKYIFLFFISKTHFSKNVIHNAKFTETHELPLKTSVIRFYEGPIDMTVEFSGLIFWCWLAGCQILAQTSQKRNFLHMKQRCLGLSANLMVNMSHLLTFALSFESRRQAIELSA